MKKIAVINDLSGLGRCSLTAAIPAISAMGVQACPLPTAVLSNQTGYPSYFCDDYTDRMEYIMAEWEKRGFRPDGIYTGFLAGEGQADKILSFIERFGAGAALILVDTVMGDQGRAYDIYTPGLCEKMRLLAEKAHVITPNLTEALLLLYGREEMERRWSELLRLSRSGFFAEVEKTGEKLTGRFSLTSAVITGIDYCGADGRMQMGNLVFEAGRPLWISAPRVGGSYSGTGDLFASVLSAGLVKGMSVEACVKKAVRFLSEAIRATVDEGSDRNDGVCFEAYLYELWEDEKC